MAAATATSAVAVAEMVAGAADGATKPHYT
jgi:hypothetical protein